MPAYLLFAVIAALFFSISSLFNKQAMAQGCGPLRIYMTQAWCGALLLSPFLFRGEPVPANLWWQPLLAACCWFSASTLYVHTLRDGDLSIIGPVAGIKPVFNAALTAALLRLHVPLTTWIACALAALALTVMRTPSSRGSLSFRRTALQTLGAVFLYALTDLCIQRWAGGWGPLRFCAIIFLTGALLSLSLIPRFGKRFTDLPLSTRKLFLTGAFFACIPSLLISFSIGRFGHAAEINVAYNLHVLSTLFAVWVFGRHLGNREHTAGARIFLRRLAGAIILLAAVFLILAGRTP